MLKTCLDCFLGNPAGNRQEYDGAYAASTVNGVQVKPPPTKYNNMKLYPLPQLKTGDMITIRGILENNPSQMTINLVTGFPSIDYDNIAFQFDADFTSDVCRLSVVRNGQTLEGYVNPEDLTPRSLFTDLNFSMQFKANEDDSSITTQQLLSVSCNGSHVMEFDKLEHDLGDIRYLMLSGDVEKLTNLTLDFA